MSKDTVNTGIEGLDELLCGGIPKGSTVLLSGPPGAGKTVLSLQYAFNHASRGEKVLFVSTCEPLYKINRYASSLSSMTSHLNGFIVAMVRLCVFSEA
jgi:circadian clock protein KaiC